MLKTKLIHPEILEALASNGHGAKILIADANFPVNTKAPSSSKKVFLNLAPGLLAASDVLNILKDYVPFESALMMASPDDVEQPIHVEFRSILGEQIELKKLKRTAFYEAVAVQDTCLVIATGEARRFANILLTIGVVLAKN